MSKLASKQRHAADAGEHHLGETETVDITPSQQDDLVSKLSDLVRLDQRLEKVAVLCQPGASTVQIGGQDPFFTHVVDMSRLSSSDLRGYAREIVDEWEAQRGIT